MTTLDFVLLVLLDTFTPLSAVESNIISTFTAFCVSFMANKRYTFKTSGTNVIREMVLFTIVTLFGLWVLQSAIIHWLLPYIEGVISPREIALIATKAVATFVSMIWNYFTYSRVVFVHKNDNVDEEE